MNTTLKLSSFTQSTSQNAELVDKAGYGVVEYYTDVKAEYSAIRHGAGIYDATANGLIKVSGGQFLEFVNDFITIDIEFLDIEKSVFSLILDEQGNIIDLVTVYLLDESIIIETSPIKRETIFTRLRELSTVHEVEIEDLTESTTLLQIEGPYSWKVCEKLIDFEISSIPFQSFVEFEYNEQAAILARTGVTGEYGYKVFVKHEHAVELYNFLLSQNHREFLVKPVGYKALTITMLEIRQPHIEFDLNGLSVYEATAEWLISFNKEQFIGKDALLNKREQQSNRIIVGFALQAENELQAGDVVCVDGPIGEIIQIEYSYELKKYIGLILINKEIGVSNLTIDLTVERLQKSTQIQTISSPYIIPISWKNKIT
ncbi:hypothetical protein [Metabacillus malikii]|uniref:Aminomethyltransferase n=1 Tax=Metabacillus malikii TaxID=1504265 RepID=A0ABT9Z9Z8_9BACI|nr:hypothetical protein [Metabacillus malikii]MDQ0229078.1 aminomethyltransferase [Metabacillus malikii]